MDEKLLETPEMVEDDWCRGDGETYEDFELTLEGANDLPALDLQDEERYEYNQWSSKDCTLYSAIWAISDLFNVEFTASDIAEVVEKSYEMWRIKWYWWNVKDGVDCVCKRWNEKHPNDTVAYYKVSLWDSTLIEEILSKNYTLCVGFQWNSEYQADYRADAKLDWYKFWKKTYGHAVSLINNKWVRTVKDNYKGRVNNGRKTNLYEMVKRTSDMVAWQTYYANWYLIVKVNSEARLAELKRLNKFKEQLEIAIEANSSMRHLTNDQEYRDWLHANNEKNRAKMKDIEREMNKFSL